MERIASVIILKWITIVIQFRGGNITHENSLQIKHIRAIFLVANFQLSQKLIGAHNRSLLVTVLPIRETNHSNKVDIYYHSLDLWQSKKTIPLSKVTKSIQITKPANSLFLFFAKLQFARGPYFCIPDAGLTDPLPKIRKPISDHAQGHHSDFPRRQREMLPAETDGGC